MMQTHNLMPRTAVGERLAAPIRFQLKRVDWGMDKVSSQDKAELVLDQGTKIVL